MQKFLKYSVYFSLLLKTLYHEKYLNIPQIYFKKLYIFNFFLNLLLTIKKKKLPNVFLSKSLYFNVKNLILYRNTFNTHWAQTAESSTKPIHWFKIQAHYIVHPGGPFGSAHLNCT